MRVRVGTSGYSFKEWKGHFYPETIKSTEMLAFYAKSLDTVEINNTFYRMPKRAMLLGWAEQVPDDFSFVLKASRRITHQKRLGDCEETLGYLLRSAAVLEGRLGPILFQMPPFFKKDVPALREFLKILPDDLLAAFEFRNSSWFDDEVYDALRARNRAWVVSDGAKNDPPAIVATADYGYLRLRSEDYDDDALSDWARRIQDQQWKAAWVFFKHEEAGAGPKLAARFNEILSRPLS
jgi:uncharacterized protein YecE (DUF72 family)